MKNKVLKAITFVAAMTVIVAGSMLDSVSYLPHIACFISLAWICPFIYANRERYCK